MNNAGKFFERSFADSAKNDGIFCYRLKDTDLSQLGKARQVKIQKENTIIVDGAGDKDKISSRVKQIRTRRHNINP